ncbi:hypothetical protein [Ensifer sp. B1-9]|uniref:hypothetical protein n=1 Tax=Ensifer sp. B1-9 TaxID=3141455 RepID=UPI003D1FE2AF
MGEGRLPALESDLAQNPDLADRLIHDPQAVLNNYGVTIDDTASSQIRDLLNAQVNSGVNPQAVYVAVKI